MDLKRIREMYPEGTCIELHNMEGEDQSRMYYGLRGTVTGVDDIGQIHMHWENGSSLALNTEVDSFETVKPREKIKVVYVEPSKLACEREIDTDLRSLQEAIGGMIETYYPFEEEVCIVCNDEGKINGMPLNRAMRDEDGKIYEIIAGPFFICDCSTDEFASLSPEQINKYTEMFRNPEEFFRMGNEVMAIPYTPVEPGQER